MKNTCPLCKNCQCPLPPVGGSDGGDEHTLMFLGQRGHVCETAAHLLALAVSNSDPETHQSACEKVQQKLVEILGTLSIVADIRGLLLLATNALPSWMAGFADEAIIKDICLRRATLEVGGFPKISPNKTEQGFGLNIGGDTLSIEQLNELDLLNAVESLAFDVVVCNNFGHPLPEFIDRHTRNEWNLLYSQLCSNPALLEELNKETDNPELLNAQKEVRRRIDNQFKDKSWPRPVKDGLLLLALSSMPNWLTTGMPAWFIQPPSSLRKKCLQRLVVYRCAQQPDGYFPQISPNDKGLNVGGQVFGPDELSSLELLAAAQTLAEKITTQFFMPKPLLECIRRETAASWGAAMNALHAHRLLK